MVACASRQVEAMTVHAEKQLGAAAEVERALSLRLQVFPPESAKDVVHALPTRGEGRASDTRRAGHVLIFALVVWPAGMGVCPRAWATPVLF